MNTNESDDYQDMSSHEAGKGEKDAAASPALKRSGGELILTDGSLSLKADFASMASRLKRGTLGAELLVRAAKLKKPPEDGRVPTLIDATAGLGEDAILLAAAGFSVTMYERNQTIAALLEDAMVRASAMPELAEIISRMVLVKGDSIEAMRGLKEAPDVIYLDPMFPERRKSALIKKKFQLLQQLEVPCADEEELLSAAAAAHPRRIVIKRPAKGPYLAGVRPDYSVSGTSIRYDCLAFPEG